MTWISVQSLQLPLPCFWLAVFQFYLNFNPAPYRSSSVLNGKLIFLLIDWFKNGDMNQSWQLSVRWSCLEAGKKGPGKGFLSEKKRHTKNNHHFFSWTFSALDAILGTDASVLCPWNGLVPSADWRAKGGGEERWKGLMSIVMFWVIVSPTLQLNVMCYNGFCYYLNYFNFDFSVTCNQRYPYWF